MAELQLSHQITLKILKEIPSDKTVTLYKLRETTKNTMSTLRTHINFLEQLSIITVDKKYTGKKLAYEVKLTDVGKIVVKGI